MAPSRAEGSTTAGVPLAPRRRSVVVRGIATAALAAFVLAGATGLFGERVAVVRADDGEGRSLAVTYAPVVRGGLDVPWRVELEDPRGLPDEVVLAVDPAYFQMFESQRFYPEPAEEARDGETWQLTFDTTGGTSLVVEFDAYVQPRFTGGRTGSVTVVDDSRPQLAVHFSTALMP